MTGKNVKERIGLGGMDADRIREIMGEAPACPRKRRGTSGNDIIRPARKNGPMQPSVYVFSPMLMEALPLSLEEIFIYELGGEDYAVRDIVL